MRGRQQLWPGLFGADVFELRPADSVLLLLGISGSIFRAVAVGIGCALLKRADLLLCVSGVTPLRDDRPRPKRAAVIDTDPVFTQLRMTDDQQFRGYCQQFDAVATFGRLIGTSDCPLPTHGMNWIPTNQPIALRHWPVAPSSSRRFTTVGKWEHTSDRHLEFAGEKYRSSKGVEWMKVIDLPRRTKWEMAIGMAAMSGEAKEQFTKHGWQLLDAEAATIDCPAFAKFIAESAGEFTVAKEIYAKLPEWVVQRSQRGVSGQWEAGGDAGEWI
jgi:hypothetical protein